MRYVALLRGINVGGHRKISMDSLRALFAALGHDAVSTYIQSGNVVFDSTSADEAVLVAEIEARIAADLRLDVAVVLRTAEELAAVVERNPLLARGCEPKSLHVTFLAAAPAPAHAQALQADAARCAPDELVVAGREIYLHCPAGLGRTKLTALLGERRLGTTATTRNWNTIVALAGLTRG